MELSIASRGKTSSVFDPRKEDAQFKESLEYQTKESMAVVMTSTKASTRQKLKEKVANEQAREVKNQYTLKELPTKVYPFLDSHIPAILDELLTKKVIALLDSKRPKEFNKIDDPMYCKFHRIICHHTTKCFILKKKIMTSVREGNIIIDDGETAETNHSSVKLDHKKDSISEALPPMASPKIEYSVIILQFGSFEPVKFSALKKTTNTSKVYDFFSEKNANTWILVARKRQKCQGTSKL
ncbi:hypothetical protein KY290_007580 [Solanum tuberosum]|uniref:Ty3-gypsy retrotransposon protein n=1 Tax=Solanum tuberosum TaxID=4113 RepID=A0ABQ7W644_SOLTU|nr:hypothetical protein KY290_007580 [Solanum tuberosum]